MSRNDDDCEIGKIVHEDVDHLFGQNNTHLSKRTRAKGLVKVLRFLNVKLAHDDFDQTYQVIKTIAEGATAKVIEVENLYTHKSYAMKKISLENFHKDKRIASILVELHCLQKLRHENIIQCKKVIARERVSSEVFIILELMECSLHSYVQSADGALPLQEQQVIMSDVFSALEYMHSSNFVHR